jgi:hypothetical protein
MQFYLSALDDKVKLEEENPSIGIIICKSKVKTVVEYAFKDVNKPIGVATYKIIKELPKEIKKYLPSQKEIEKRLSLFRLAIVFLFECVKFFISGQVETGFNLSPLILKQSYFDSYSHRKS